MYEEKKAGLHQALPIGRLLGILYIKQELNWKGLMVTCFCSSFSGVSTCSGDLNIDSSGDLDLDSSGDIFISIDKEIGRAILGFIRASRVLL